MITVAPGALPVTTPDIEPIVAFVLLLLQVPPVVASLKVMDDPTHTAVGPVIVAGEGFTVTVVVAKQLVGNV